MAAIVITLTEIVESEEPAFLRRLRGECGGEHRGRSHQSQARLRKAKDTEADGDDAPTYVFENGQDMMTKAEYDALLLQGARAEEPVVEEESKVDGDKNSIVPAPSDKSIQSNANDEVQQDASVKERNAAIGTSSRKRVAKVVKDDEGEEQDCNDAKKMNTMKKPLKKSKKVKLSFDHE